MKRWKIGKPDAAKAADIASRCDIDRLAVDVLVSRGYDDIDSFAAFFQGGGLEDPFVIKDMDKAAETVTQAVDDYELICIYGDYDCDGITSTALLYDYLLSIGANVTYYIPERADGYGLNVNAVRYLHDQGVKLIITVDNGISAIDEAEEIYSLGMRLVVTDHHEPGETLPRAEAVVDPHREDCPSAFKGLCGCGVALKLCAALDGGSYDSVLEQYLDICAIGTVADIVPLTDENRFIVKNGLRYLENTDNFGLRALKEAAGFTGSLRSSSIAFGLSPRINSAGRFGSPITALKLLLSTQEDAEVFAGMLTNLNDRRKETESQISAEIFEHINSHPEILDERVLIITGEGWAHGVIGIVAARVMDYYGKPTILISEEGGELRGSARSIKGFNIFKCFQHASDTLTKFGGHECAGGLTVKEGMLDEFKAKVYEYAAAFEEMPAVTLTADKLLEPSDLTVEHVRGLEKLEPFGEGNPSPVFAMIGAQVTGIRALSGGKHTKLSVNYGGVNAELLMFGTPPQKLCIGTGSRADFIVTLEISEFGGRECVSIKVSDYRPSGFNQNAYFSAKDAYERFKRGEQLASAFYKKITPSRDELAGVYKLVKGKKQIDLDRLYYSFDPRTMNYCKLRICVDICKELGLFSFKAGSSLVTIAPSSGRVDLERSLILAGLRAKIAN